MAIVKIHDKRYINGYRIKFFKSEEITEEIIQYVKNTPNAYWVKSYSECYYNREDFLKKYNH